ncbi:hypothetical protein [Aquimarina mytili]|uniref:HTH araC/xylS-type domain-containing protein n=1 Tax=Aquimarina mytili TaxID=874423 RepID=A0A937D7U7_9FLAO|nr:hypothetical protein [Aquimarina mytili]MBL0683440.1 hypothetical protein [Aquimarina mytili]
MKKAFNKYIKHRLPIAHWVLDFYELHLTVINRPFRFLPSGFSYLFFVFGDDLQINVNNKITVRGVVSYAPNDNSFIVQSLGKTKLLVAQCTSLVAANLSDNNSINPFGITIIQNSLELVYTILEPQYYVSNYLENLDYQEEPILFNHILRHIDNKQGLVTDSEIAKRYSCSTQYIEQQFRKYLHTEPCRFFEKTRLYYCSISLISNVNNQTVIQQYGYNRMIDFYTCFQNTVGVQFESFLEQFL